MVDIRIATPTGARQDPAAQPYGMNPDHDHVAVVQIDAGAMARIPLPRWTTHLQLQRRMAGDYRAELKASGRFVDAAHRDLAEAIAAACAKVAA